MNGFQKCIIYLALTGFGSFVVGRFIPKRWLRYDRFPFLSFAFEKDGEIYVAIGIRKWKDILPDMSKIFPWAMPSKKVPKNRSAALLEVMVQETCIAELVHVLLCAAGFRCVFLWQGVGGWAVAALFALGNLPFILIQRHNRPKLIRVMEKLRKKENEDIKHEYTAACQ